MFHFLIDFIVSVYKQRLLTFLLSLVVSDQLFQHYYHQLSISLPIHFSLNWCHWLLLLLLLLLLRSWSWCWSWLWMLWFWFWSWSFVTSRHCFAISLKLQCTEKISVSMVMRGWVGESISSVANSLWRLICSYFFSFVALHTL